MLNLLGAGTTRSSMLCEQFSLRYKNLMKSTQNNQNQAFSNFLTQIKIYINSKDIDSVQYLLDGQDSQQIAQIIQQLTPNQKKSFQQMTASLTKKASNTNKQPQRDCQSTVKAALFYEKNNSESQVLQNFQKQFKVTDIVYGQNYSYPFLGLLQKMSSVYFFPSHPNPFPESSLKMLHSLIETLFSYVFNHQVKENYQNKKRHHKKKFQNYLKEYLFFVFEKEYQKFATFHKLFKSIKSSLSQKQISEDDLNFQKSKSLQNSPLTCTQNLEQLEYFQKISQEISNEKEFKEFNKIKCLNFLYFGEKKLKQLIDPEQKFLAERIQKQILQLISFLLCRFVRKVILGCIRSKKDNNLKNLEKDEKIQSIEVKMIGNQLIDQYSKKVDSFLKLDQPIQQIAKRTFLCQFYEYDYEKFIPLAILEQSVKKLQNQKKSSTCLPEEVWNSSKYYQSLWIQRIAAEEYIRQNFEHQNLKREKGKRNDYAHFIEQNLKLFDENTALLWIKYLTLIHKNQLHQTEAKDPSSLQKQKWFIRLEKELSYKVCPIEKVKPMKIYPIDLGIERIIDTIINSRLDLIWEVMIQLTYNCAFNSLSAYLSQQHKYNYFSNKQKVSFYSIQPIFPMKRSLRSRNSCLPIQNFFDKQIPSEFSDLVELIPQQIISKFQKKKSVHCEDLVCTQLPNKPNQKQLNRIKLASKLLKEKSQKAFQRLRKIQEKPTINNSQFFDCLLNEQELTRKMIKFEPSWYQGPVYSKNKLEYKIEYKEKNQEDPCQMRENSLNLVEKESENIVEHQVIEQNHYK